MHINTIFQRNHTNIIDLGLLGVMKLEYLMNTTTTMADSCDALAKLCLGSNNAPNLYLFAYLKSLQLLLLNSNSNLLICTKFKNELKNGIDELDLFELFFGKNYGVWRKWNGVRWIGRKVYQYCERFGEISNFLHSEESLIWLWNWIEF